MRCAESLREYSREKNKRSEPRPSPFINILYRNSQGNIETLELASSIIDFFGERMIKAIKIAHESGTSFSCDPMTVEKSLAWEKYKTSTIWSKKASDTFDSLIKEFC